MVRPCRYVRSGILFMAGVTIMAGMEGMLCQERRSADIHWIVLRVFGVVGMPLHPFRVRQSLIKDIV